MSTPVPLSTSEFRHKKVFEGFREFIARGSMIDMAVGVVMGNAVTAIVKSLVTNFLNPLIAMIFGKPDLGGLLQVHFNHATISFGAILNDVLNFLLVALAVYFCVIVPINKFRDLTDKARRSRAAEKMKFWKHARRGSTLERMVREEEKIAGKVGLSGGPHATAPAGEAETGESSAKAGAANVSQGKIVELLQSISDQLAVISASDKEGRR